MENNGDVVGEIKSRLNVEDVVSQYIQLKRSGRNFKGLSPFTNEKTPSFMVSPEKQIWHDFSSGRGGDIFTFVMEMEGVDFRGAIEILARQAGVDLEQFQSRPSGSGKLKNRLGEASELAAEYYQRHLLDSQPALKYLVRQRKFNKQSIMSWRLGYSPNLPKGLTDFLVKKGFSLTEIRRAGLAVERRGQTIDMFRGRIMIPLCDAQGAVVGFTARLILDEPNAPKYINTPSTPLYDKGRQVFGLHLAKEAIRKTGFVVVVEGNLDVISSHQAGVANVVASAGTAMTEAHLLALKRFTGDIRLSFDADPAGIAAVERIIPLGQKVGVDLKIISLPAGAKDPDELVKKDPKAWQKTITKAQGAVGWLIEQYKSQLNLDSAEGKKKFTDVLLTTLKRLADQVEQEHYLKTIAKLTDTSIETLKAKMGTTSEAKIRLKKPSGLKPIDKNEAEYRKYQTHLLSIGLFEPAAHWLFKDLPEDIFDVDDFIQLAKFIKSLKDNQRLDKLPAKLNKYSNSVKILEIQFEELYQGLDITERVRQATLVRHRLVDMYVKPRMHALAEKMQAATGKKLEQLITQANNLNKLLT